MKKKKIPLAEPVISSQILDEAKKSAHPDKLPRHGNKCAVCGSECATNSSEQLCWVCRRLKFSAWHESEQQTPAQE
jgi:hypothetical protein